MRKLRWPLTQMGSVGLEGEIAELVDDQELGLGVMRNRPAKAAGEHQLVIGNRRAIGGLTHFRCSSAWKRADQA